MPVHTRRLAAALAGASVGAALGTSMVGGGAGAGCKLSGVTRATCCVRASQNGPATNRAAAVQTNKAKREIFDTNWASVGQTNPAFQRLDTAPQLSATRRQLSDPRG